MATSIKKPVKHVQKCPCGNMFDRGWKVNRVYCPECRKKRASKGGKVFQRFLVDKLDE
jgi:hypothetical protein